MKRKVEWSELAKSDFVGITRYLFLHWNASVAIRFIDKADHLIHLISKNPLQFPEVNHALGIRKCVISRQNTLYYRYDETSIEIIRLFDTRQDPRELKFK